MACAVARRHGAWVAGLMLALLALPAQANHVTLDAHLLVVEGQSARILEAANLTRLTVDYNVTAESIPSPPDGTDPLGLFAGPTCEESNVTLDEAARTFTFSETRDGDGCADVRLDVLVPAGAERIVVRFNATRIVQGLEGQSPNTGSSLLQQFRIFGADGTQELSKDYYDDTEGDHEVPEDFVLDEPLGPGRSNITLSWLFDDEGLQGEGISSQQAFEATVGNVTFEWPNVRLDAPVVQQDPEQPKNETHAIAQFRVTLGLPPSVLAAHLNTSLLVVVRHGPVFRGLEGPMGPVDVDALAQVDEGGRLEVRVPAAVLAPQGPGPYTFLYETSRPLPPSEPAPPPTRILPFYYTMLVLPAPAAGLSLYSGLAYRREAEGRYRRASSAIVGLIGTAIVYYVLLVLYAVYGAGSRVMTTLPLRPEATLVYVQLLVLLLFFVVSAVVVGRYLARAMRRDLEIRRQQEERLRRSNEELERFAYVASHDLQEPLRKVAGFTSLLQRRYKGRLDKDADEMIQYAVDGATRMQALIRDILAYSRVGSSELDLKPIEVGSVLELVVSDLGEKIKDEKALVEWDDLPLVEADAGQLRQILQNLVENGVKYRHPSRRPRIRVAAERDGAMWRFSVSDNGVGIPADKLTDIFGIFRRLHGAEVPGTGIGLALAKKAVERHGGKIWAESREGKGSTFYFTLPEPGHAATGWRDRAEPLRPSFARRPWPEAA